MWCRRLVRSSSVASVSSSSTSSAATSEAVETEPSSVQPAGRTEPSSAQRVTQEHTYLNTGNHGEPEPESGSEEVLFLGLRWDFEDAPALPGRNVRFYCVWKVPAGVPVQLEGIHYGEETRAFDGLCSLDPGRRTGRFGFKRCKSIHEAEQLLLHKQLLGAHPGIRHIRWHAA